MNTDLFNDEICLTVENLEISQVNDISSTENKLSKQTSLRDKYKLCFNYVTRTNKLLIRVSDLKSRITNLENKYNSYDHALEIESPKSIVLIDKCILCFSYSTKLNKLLIKKSQLQTKLAKLEDRYNKCSQQLKETDDEENNHSYSDGYKFIITSLFKENNSLKKKIKILKSLKK